MNFITDFADQAVILPLVLAVAAILLLQGWRRGAVAWLVAVGVTFAAMLALKLVFLACWQEVAGLHIHTPSGHVAAAAIAVGGMTEAVMRRRIAALPVAFLGAVVIGLTRVLLHEHTLPEVLLGGAVGLAGTALLLRLSGPPPLLQVRPVVLAALAMLVVFHGFHLPAEAGIRETALFTSRLLAVCQGSPMTGSPMLGGQVRP